MIKTQFLQTSPLLTGERDEWVKNTVAKLGGAMQLKYSRGQIEHDGDLGQVPTEQLLVEIQHEAIDTLLYVAELNRRMQSIGHDIVITPAERAAIGEIHHWLGTLTGTDHDGDIQAKAEILQHKLNSILLK